MEKKVFISYSPEDSTYANLLARTLKKKGVQIFTGQDIMAGENWEDTLRKELEESSAVIAIISDNWNRSTWAATEYGAAYALGKKIIPVLIDDISSELTIDIKRFLSVDGKNEDLESVAHQVEEALV